MNFRLSLRSKLFFSILLILILSFTTLIYSTIKTLNRSFDQKINGELEERLHYVRDQYLEMATAINRSLMQPATAPPVLEHVKKRDAGSLTHAVNRWQKILPEVDFTVIIDENRRIIAPGRPSLLNEKLELGAVIDKVFKQKESVIATELATYRLLRKMGHADYGASLPGGEAMMLTVAVPIMDGERVAGVIVAGDVINRDPHLLHLVRRTFGPRVQVIFTQRDKKIAGTGRDGFDLPGTLAPEVLDRLEKNQPFRGEALIGNTTYLTAFDPLINSSGEFIGSVSVALSKDEVKRIRYTNLMNIFASASVGIVLAFGMAYLVARRLTKPFQQLAESARRIEQGDYGQRILGTGDEHFEMLAQSFNNMIAALEERDHTITKKTLDLEMVNRRLKELNELLERKVGERTAELQMEMGRLETILTSMAEGIVVTDKDDKVILFNPAAQKLLNVIPHRVVGQSIEQAGTLGSYERLLSSLKEIRAEGQDSEGREEEITVQGKKLKISLNPLLDRRGRFAGVVMSLRDVTVEEEMNQMKTDFISTVSHELKTPLTSMKGSLQLILMKGEGLNPTERDLLSICLRNTERLIRLISEILDISKIEAGAVKFSLKPSSISELIEYSIDEIKGFALEHQVSIVNGISTPLPLVYVDSDRLIQVITNLLANAVKFSPQGKEIVVTARRDSHYVAVSVADQGQPIQWSDRRKLFKKFQQFESAEMKGRGGTGLGLAICKEIIEKHHGKITYRPGDSMGNVFTFTVPVFEES